MLNETALKIPKFLFLGFTALLLLCIGISIYAENIAYVLIPLGLIFPVLAIADYKYVYYFLIASIPVSIHFFFGSLAMDIVSEPLMISLLVLSPLVIIINNKKFKFLYHPIIFILVCQFTWSIFSTLFSVDYIVSIKYLIAKLWFIIPFVLIGALVLDKGEDFKKVFWLYFIPLLFVVVYTTIAHYQQGFSFESANFVMQPFFHNHVDYSTAIAVFVPFVWFARYWYPPYSYTRLLINFGLVLFLFAVIISFTRASWLALAMSIPAFIIIKKNLTKPAVYAGIAGLVFVLFYIYHQNKYLDFSKDYRKVIFHEGDIEKHLEATYQLEDVSGMERVYRWMAAQNMIKDKFFIGSGPNTFYPEYKKYTIVMFQTYVSDNPERSTTHNYFLMVFAEQGVVGFLLFAGLYIFLLMRGTKLYRTFTDPVKKNLAMAATLSLIMLFLHLCFNDLIETDKSGSLYFISIALILKLDYWRRQEAVEATIQNKSYK